MYYSMKQRVLAVADDFVINDHNNRSAYFVHGIPFSFGKKFSFQDKHKQELVFIRQKLFSFWPTYRIYRHAKQIATITKWPFSFRPKFYFRITGQKTIEITGKLIENEYIFTIQKKEVARIAKKYFRDSDTFGIEVHDGADPVMILCAAVVVDMICYSGKEHGS